MVSYIKLLVSYLYPFWFRSKLLRAWALEPNSQWEIPSGFSKTSISERCEFIRRPLQTLICPVSLYVFACFYSFNMYVKLLNHEYLVAGFRAGHFGEFGPKRYVIKCGGYNFGESICLNLKFNVSLFSTA